MTPEQKMDALKSLRKKAQALEVEIGELILTPLDNVNYGHAVNDSDSLAVVHRKLLQQRIEADFIDASSRLQSAIHQAWMAERLAIKHGGDK
jgi:hypothetical protein